MWGFYTRDADDAVGIVGCMHFRDWVGCSSCIVFVG